MCDRYGRSLAVIEAKKSSINAADAQDQAKAYAEQLNVPYIFLANGEEILFWEYRNQAHPHPVKTFFSQTDLERRAASLSQRRDPLTIPIDTDIAGGNGRDYQIHCINALCENIQQGRRKSLVEMATGTGKTRTAGALLKRLFDAGVITRALFLVDRITLANQTGEAFADYLRDYPSYVLRKGRFQDEKIITITTLQSMIQIYRDYSSGYFDLIITDECHRSIYGKWSGILNHFDGIKIGLTATPCVSHAEFGDDEDQAAVRDTLRFFELDKPTFRYGMKEAIEDGFLVPYQIYQAQTVKTASDGEFEVKRTEIDWTNLNDTDCAELEAAFDGQDKILVDPKSLERKYTIPERNRAMVREFRQVMEQGYADQHGNQRKPLLGKTIVFAVTKRHAETLARLFDEHFADHKPSPETRYADYVVSGLGAEQDTSDSGTRIKRFKKEAFPQILVSVNMLDTGFDYPDVKNLVFARYTESAILYRQIRGRGARKAKNKPVFTMFDFIGVTELHGDAEDYADGTALVIREPKTKKPYQPRKLLTLDVDDHIDPTTRQWVTLDADGNMQFTEPAQAQQNQIHSKFEAWRLSHDDELNAEQRQWLNIIGEQIKANADTLESFELDYFDIDFFPALKNRGGKWKAVEAFGSEARLVAMLEEMNRAVFLA